MNTLDLYLGDRRAGVLTLDGDAVSFTYDAAWRADPGAYPLSPPLGFGVRVDASWPARCRRYLENLLPEGRALDDLVARHAVSRSNVFALVRIVGRETAGAVALLPSGDAPPTSGTRREIPFAELSERIRAREQVPFSVWDGRVRMSIAGQQDKIGVRRAGDQLELVDGALATTHLLKPEPPRFPGLVANEAFCQHLAAASGIAAAETTILRVPEPVLCVRRFDRAVVGDDVRRLHVIDGLQALDLPVSHKYERWLGSGRDVAVVRDGASIPRLQGLAVHSPAPALLRRDLLRRHVFDLLVGNSDAHGKNVSFYVTSAGLSLAPAYDTVCVAAWPDLDADLALAIGDQFDGEAVGPADWRRLADDCVLPPRFVLGEVRGVATRVRRALGTLRDDLAVTQLEREMLATVRAVVERRIARILG